MTSPYRTQIPDRSRAIASFEVGLAALRELISSVLHAPHAPGAAAREANENARAVDLLVRRSWANEKTFELIARSEIPCAHRNESAGIVLKRIAVHLTSPGADPQEAGGLDSWLSLPEPVVEDLLEFLTDQNGSEVVAVRFGAVGDQKIHLSISIPNRKERFRVDLDPKQVPDPSQPPGFWQDWALPIDGVLTFDRADFLSALSRLRGRGASISRREMFHFLIHKAVSIPAFTGIGGTALRLVSVTREGEVAKVDLVAVCSPLVRDGGIVSLRAQDLLACAKHLDAIAPPEHNRLHLGYGSTFGWAWLSTNRNLAHEVQERQPTGNARDAGPPELSDCMVTLPLGDLP
jgi:hypothetical protein